MSLFGLDWLQEGLKWNCRQHYECVLLQIFQWQYTWSFPCSNLASIKHMGGKMQTRNPLFVFKISFLHQSVCSKTKQLLWSNKTQTSERSYPKIYTFHKLEAFCIPYETVCKGNTIKYYNCCQWTILKIDKMLVVTTIMIRGNQMHVLKKYKQRQKMKSTGWLVHQTGGL